MRKKGPQFSAEQMAVENQRFIVKVYFWMSFALIITGFVAMWTASTPPLVETIMDNSWVYYGIILLELVFVFFLAARIDRISVQTASLMFLGYSFLNGLTLSVIFLIFTTASIASTFFITAGTFFVMSVYGYFTKTDLTGFGNLMLMALLGLFITMLVNMFLQSESVSIITACFGVLIFTGLMAYDTQKIKKMNIIGNDGTEEDKKEAILGALTLYLDFVNLFLSFLRLFGKRKF